MCSNSPTEPTIRKSKSSSIGQSTCGVRLSSSVLLIHWMNESEPFERNWAWSSNSRTSSERFAAASRIRSVLPTSPGRTTCRSSMKKTDTRPASRMSSICAFPDRALAGVKRLVLMVRMRCASSRMTTSSGSVDVLRVAEVLEERARAATDELAQVLSERLRAGDMERPEAERRHLGDEVDRDDRFAGARTARDDERDLVLVLAGDSDRIDDGVVGDLLLVQEREHGLVADHSSDVVEQALVGPKLGGGDLLDDRAVVRAGDPRVEEARELVQLIARERRVGRQERREVGSVERRHRVIGRVVQIGAGSQGDAAVGERGVRVHQVALVLGDLARWVQVVDRVGRRSRPPRSR